MEWLRNDIRFGISLCHSLCPPLGPAPPALPLPSSTPSPPSPALKSLPASWWDTHHPAVIRSAFLMMLKPSADWRWPLHQRCTLTPGEKCTLATPSTSGVSAPLSLDIIGLALSLNMFKGAYSLESMHTIAALVC